MPPMSPHDQNPPKKITFPEALVARTAAGLAPGAMKAALEHKGSAEYQQALLVATMIELAMQNPGPMSEKAKAHQEKIEAESKTQPNSKP